jgi:ABC transporter substrate binding protein (PQQ-dependent alcohol dehydrogenase system)
LNQRFEKLAGRPMEDADWAGWVAVKAIVEAAVKAKTVDSAGIRRALVSDEIAIDFYKGTPGNFRAWDRQLRQPVLLHTHNAVIARAPLDGFLHRSNNLDTLGLDAPETGCRQPTK